MLPLDLVSIAPCFWQQLHDWMDKGQERHIENNQKETKAQGPWHGQDGHQNGPQRLLFQLLHPTRG